jgi:PKD repeat protein
MNPHKIVKKNLILFIILTILLISATITLTHPAEILSTISITVTTNKPSYYLRQIVTILGNLTTNGTPVDNALVAIEIRDPRDNPFYFRTITIGNPSETWPIEITQFVLTDLSGNPLTKAKINSQAKVHVTAKNKLLNSLDVVTAISVCDENLIPIYSAWSQTTISGGDQSNTSWTFLIPEWTKPGKAIVFINAYNTLLENQGIPYMPEQTAYFDIVRNIEAEPSHAQLKETFNSTNGKYEAYMSVPPDRYTRPGTYTIYVTGRISAAVRVYTQGTLTLNSYPCPPQAAFTYSPLQVYQNMTVTLDASSSSAEGYEDTITSYEWKINDPYNPRHIIETDPITTHTFEYPGTYIVELNVTDKEGLWSTTSKPITVQPEFGPTANFTWTPLVGMVNLTMTFDASNSKLGWSASTQQFSPIINYTWDFNDGTINQTSNPIITHIYRSPGNYTVTLTIRDAVGRTDMISNIIEIQNITLKDCDVNGDNKIDIRDIFATALSYGSKPGDPNWNARCDVNKDGIIDIRDIFAIALNYGKDP